MPIPPTLEYSTQTDEALDLLAHLYARRVQSAPFAQSQPRDLVYWHACARIREVLVQAPTQQEALTRLWSLAEQSEAPSVLRETETGTWRTTVEQARDLVAQVMHAGGSAQVLLAGETDGFRHLCLRCSQQESHFQQVRFFDHRARRKLLIVEARNASRSFYSRCQICKQVLAPVKSVVLIPAGTLRHQKGCTCTRCNRAGLAWVVNLYERDESSHAVRVPRIAHLIAPSAKAARARAFAFCGDQGWAILFDQPPS